MAKNLSEIKLLPCGHSIGLNLLQKEMRVIDLLPVLKPNGLYYFPAHEWDIRIHDLILKVEGQPLLNEKDLSRLIDDTMHKKAYVKLLIKRQDRLYYKKIKPYFCHLTQTYKLGFQVKAFEVELGTLTFYDPVSHHYGAFGHRISNLPIPQLDKNTLLTSTVSDIIKGCENHPGRKLGCLNPTHEFTGSIEHDNEMGLFGTLNGKVETPFFEEGLPIGFKKQIRGKWATIYTVLQGEQIEEFDILITEVLHEETSNRDLRFVMDDSDLLLKAGGLVKGMCGSPIVQNGKFIGAVSQLSATDPYCGFGVSMENMLQESGW